MAWYHICNRVLRCCVYLGSHWSKKKKGLYRHNVSHQDVEKMTRIYFELFSHCYYLVLLSVLWCVHITGLSSHKGPVMWNFYVLLFNLQKLLNKYSSCQWCDMYLCIILRWDHSNTTKILSSFTMLTLQWSHLIAHSTNNGKVFPRDYIIMMIILIDLHVWDACLYYQDGWHVAKSTHNPPQQHPVILSYLWQTSLCRQLLL